MEEIKKYLGESVFDAYGRTIGKIINLELDANNKAESIKTLSGKGEFIEYPINQVAIEQGRIICLPPWEKEAKGILRQLNTLRKRINALDELYKSGEIREEFYKSLKSNYESSFSKIKESRENILEKAEKRKEDLINKINELQIIFANNKMQFHSGEMDEVTFKPCQEIIQKHIESALKEKNKIDDISKEIISFDETKVVISTTEEEETQATSEEPKDDMTSSTIEEEETQTTLDESKEYMTSTSMDEEKTTDDEELKDDVTSTEEEEEEEEETTDKEETIDEEETQATSEEPKDDMTSSTIEEEETQTTSDEPKDKIIVKIREDF
ncbi:MAG: CdvA-like protein [Candidatus Bathyarchaeota archaeon]|nr:CdvA-like protein [Candidatus Bathyarchaeota archaeon]